MEDANLLDDKWVKLETKTMLCILIATIVLEIIGMFILNSYEIADLDTILYNYVPLRIIVPNLIALGLIFGIKKVSNRFKPYVYILTIFLINIACILCFSFYSGIAFAMIFPITGSMILGNKKIIDFGIFLTIIEAILHCYIRYAEFSSYGIGDSIANCMIIISALLVTSYLCATFINIEEKKKEEIKKIYENEKEMRTNLSIDELTGLKNYNYFKTVLKEKVKESKKDNYQKLTIGIIEMDGFEEFNEKVGHIKTEEFLKNFSIIICEELNNLEVARTEKAQFGIIFINEDFNEIIQKIKNIKEKVNEKAYLYNEVDEITYSTIVVQYNQSLTYDKYLEKIKENIKKAEEKGKNQILMVK